MGSSAMLGNCPDSRQWMIGMAYRVDLYDLTDLADGDIVELRVSN